MRCINTLTDDELTEVFTIEEAVDKIGFGVFQVLLSLYIGATGVGSNTHMCYLCTYV